MNFIAFCEWFEHVVINNSICAQMKVKMWTWSEWEGGWYKEWIQCVTVTVYPVEIETLFWKHWQTLRSYTNNIMIYIWKGNDFKRTFVFCWSCRVLSYNIWNSIKTLYVSHIIPNFRIQNSYRAWKSSRMCISIDTHLLICFIAHALRDNNHAKCHGQWQQQRHLRQSGQRWRHHGRQQLGDGANSSAGGATAEQSVQCVRHEWCRPRLAVEHGSQLAGGYHWQGVYGAAEGCGQVRWQTSGVE